MQKGNRRKMVSKIKNEIDTYTKEITKESNHTQFIFVCLPFKVDHG